MVVKSYKIAKALSEVMEVRHLELPKLDDSYLNRKRKLFKNYHPYGGGAADMKNGHYGCKHSTEAKDKMRQKALGRKAWNKGKKNPKAKKRMLENNPMKDPKVVAKVSLALKGHVPWNKGKKGVQVAWNKGRKSNVERRS